MQPLKLHARHLVRQSSPAAASASKTDTLAGSTADQQLSAASSHTIGLQPEDCAIARTFEAPNAGQQSRLAQYNGSDSSINEKHGSQAGLANGHIMSAGCVSALAQRRTWSMMGSGTACDSSASTDVAQHASGTRLTNGVSLSNTDGTTHAYSQTAMASSEKNISAHSHENSAAAQVTWVLQIQKKHAKAAKDALKALGFLARQRRVPAADRSDAEVALPLTSSGAAYISVIPQSTSCGESGANVDVPASTAAHCGGSGHHNLSHEGVQCDFISQSGIPGKARANDLQAQQADLQYLGQLIAQGLATVEQKQSIQRSGLATPADALLQAVISILASRGTHMPSKDSLPSPIWHLLSLAHALFLYQ